MKKLISAISVTCIISLCNGQSTPVGKDTVKLDTAQVEKIQKMPMDTLQHTMPVAPLPPPKEKDNIYKPKTIDDADPKKPKSPYPKL